MKKKLFLISTNKLTSPYPVYPVGLSYVATYLENNLAHYTTRILDLNRLSQDALLEILKKERPDYIGLSMRNVDDANSYEKKAFVDGYRSLIKNIRSTVSCPIILGGAGYSIYPELLFKELAPDFGIAGEGEESFARLLTALDNKRPYKDVEGLVYSEGGTLKKNPRTTYLKDIELRYDKDIIDFYWDQSGMLSLQTKRGCPFGCIYCTYPLIEGRQVRTLNPDRIVEILKDLKTKKNINYVYFTDSVFNIEKEYNEELVKKIIENDLNIKWGAFFAPTKDFSKKEMELYKRSGLQHVEFGTESLSDPVLKAYNKHFSFKDVLRAAKICNELDIHSAHFLILGGYGETQKTLEETIENSKKIERSIFFPFVGMRIYPGTPLQKHAIEEGVISAKDELLFPKFYLAKNVDFSHLEEMTDKTGKAWVLPDKDNSALLQKLRQKKRYKGPLWEMLIK